MDIRIIKRVSRVWNGIVHTVLRRKRRHLLLACSTAMLLFIVFVNSVQFQELFQLHEVLSAPSETRGAKMLNEPVDARWQPVSGAQDKFFVYSAFYEARKEQHRSVRVIGATRTFNSTEQSWCVMKFKDQPQDCTVKAKIRIIREHHRLNYSSCFVLCPLEENQAPPVSVSIVAALQAPLTNHLVVIDNLSSQEQRGNLAVCVKPMYNYNQELNLVEFLEMYSLLGAEHFTLYQHNVSSNIDCLMHSYEQRGVATWLRWELELRSRVDIWTEGMFAALNDCLYRNMYRYDNLVMVDLDEFIIPKQGGDLVKVIRDLDANYSRAGSYVFQNAFFYQSWESVSSDDPLASRLLTLSKTRRKSKLLQFPYRTKYICKPELVVEVGNHYVWQHLRKFKSVKILPDVAVSHHYRNGCEPRKNRCLKEPSKIDNTALQYKQPLLDGVTSALKILKNMCDIGLDNIKNTDIRNELSMKESSNWLEHRRGMDDQRLTKSIWSYQPKGRRDFGYSKFRWRDNDNGSGKFA